MSPARFLGSATDGVSAAVRRFAVELGLKVRDARIARRWSAERLATEAHVSRSLVYQIERGEVASLEAALRLVAALGLRLEWDLVDPRRRRDPSRDRSDLVHAAMGELEVGLLRRQGRQVAIDDPYPHYHFAGRVDVASWDLDSRALMHIENRTRFPDLQ